MPEVLKRVGRFDLLEVIGRGGAAVVYLAVQRDLQRHVALKELAPFHLADSSFAERFVEESRLAGAMNHANVVTVHEFFEDGSVPYIAMEYLPYGSLRQYVGTLTLAQIAGALEGVLAGLAHGEAHGIVHRDLKPENLLVAADGRVKIADFGVARAYSKAATRAVVTVAGTTIGTPAYMSPEQALGGDLMPATDLYSLGVVAWELFAGEVPFQESDTPVAVLYRHVHEDVPSVRTVAPQVDERIDAWLGRMLAKQPEDRFQRAEDAWVELEDVVLDLLGPRWRREARLIVDGQVAADRAATPGPSTTSQELAAIPVGIDTPVPQTVTGLSAKQVAVPEETVAPSAPRRRSNTTIFRLARRHRDEGAQPDSGPDAMRRRIVVGAIVVAMAVAAIIGVVLAQPGPAKHHGPTLAQRQATARAAAAARQKAQVAAAAKKQMGQAINTLAHARASGLTQVLNAADPARQATDAARVQSAYRTAARRVAPLTAKSPLAAPLEKTLREAQADYGRVAAAARADRQRLWNTAWAAVQRDEKRLRSQIGQL